MGMIAKFYQVSERQLSQFLRRPSLAYDYTMSSLYDNPAAVEAVEEMLNQLRSQVARFPPSAVAQVEHVAGLLQRKKSAKMGPRLVTSEPEPEPEAERKEFSLEKDWHVLHYALNGTHHGGDSSLADAILGGREIPDVEGATIFGAGSSGALRYLTAEEVRGVAEALEEVDASQLLSKLDYHDAERKKIYLSHTLKSLNDWAYLPELFASFRAFYRDASCNGQAILLSIT